MGRAAESDERPLGPSGETTVMDSLVEMSKIFSVKCNLLEGAMGLEHGLSRMETNCFWKQEGERCRKVLENFCLFFFSSVDYEAALKQAKGKETVKVKTLATMFLSDVPLYGGIIASFSPGERNKHYSEIRRLHEVLQTGKKLTASQRIGFMKVLNELYVLADRQNSMLMRAASQDIIGERTLPNFESASATGEHHRVHCI